VQEGEFLGIKGGLTEGSVKQHLFAIREFVTVAWQTGVPLLTMGKADNVHFTPFLACSVIVVYPIVIRSTFQEEYTH
jgi:hypothetical protein